MNPSSHIGPVKHYDYMGAMQFANLFMLGLRAHNTLLDFGCGSLRLGRFAMQFLNVGCYYGIEPKGELITEGIALNHLAELVKAKLPRFHFGAECDMNIFNHPFDYIIAQSVFTHMPVAQIQKSLQTARQAMHNGSLFVANYKHAAFDYADPDWTQKNITYTAATMDAMVAKARLVATPLHLIQTTTQTWLLLRRAP